MRKPLIALALGLTISQAGSCGASSPTVVQRPITWDQDRLQLTESYLASRYGLTAKSARIEPRMVVLHWTAIPTLEQSYEAFFPSKLPNSRGDIATAGDLNVSAHYLVDRNGTIYQLMPDTLMARHTIGLNHCAIGIENVGGTGDTPLTAEQLKANAWLVRRLALKYPIRYLVGHYEYTAFEGHPLWLEKDSAYRTEKTDPGRGFMKRIRRSLRDLKLQPAPKHESL